MSEPISAQIRDIPACHRCGGEQYLTVTVAHPTLVGSRIVGLCPRCDADDPDAQGLLAYFAIHSEVRSDNVEYFGTLVRRWTKAVALRTPDPQAQADDERAWRDGDL